MKSCDIRHGLVSRVTRGLVLWAIAMPSPSPGAMQWQEDFSSEPHGWAVHGDTNLFAWESDPEWLRVTWDSSRPNSYFHRPLGTILAAGDDFSMRFRLRLDAIAIGVDPAKPYTFELAIGFVNLASATDTNFFRGAGINATYGPRNLVEFDYFPDSGFGATVAPTIVSTNNRLRFSDNHPLELTVDDWFEVSMDYSGSNRVLRTSMWRNGDPFGLGGDAGIADLSVSGFPDFRVDTMAICSYNDGHQPSPMFAGSLLAQGVVDDIAVTVPGPPVRDLQGGFEQGTWRVTFLGRSNWLYTLECTEDLQEWRSLGNAPGTTSGRIVLRDLTPREAAFYRVRSERP